MLLKLNAPYAISLGEDLNFLGNYYKGKKVTGLWENFRYLFDGVKTGTRYLLIPSVRDLSFMGLELNFEQYFKEVAPGHLKLKNYNYYHIDDDPTRLERLFQEWRQSDPLLHIGNHMLDKMSIIKHYTWAYSFNGKNY